MHPTDKIRFMLTAALWCGLAPAVYAHPHAGSVAGHWHASDLLGVATVTALSVAALWLAGRPRRGAKE